MAMIFVSHDIAASVEVSDRIAVMYAGRIVEENVVAALVEAPRHPYTAGLLASTVTPSRRGRPLPTIAGAPPDLSALPPGCAFAQRCSRAVATCHTEQPPLTPEGHAAIACWNPIAFRPQTRRSDAPVPSSP
jgi:peptide/nickel transport system ATP-binding protein